MLADPTFNTLMQYSWGFTIYRVRFDGDSEERFASALRRFDLWTRWLIRAFRYCEDDVYDPIILPNGEDPTDQLAESLYHQVVELTLGENQQVVTKPEGKEDFSTVGTAFSVHVASLNSKLSPLNARFEQYLIIDKAALETLEKLPDMLPPIEHYHSISGRRALRSVYYGTWIWVLDRRTCELWAAGGERDAEFPPWARLRICHLQNLWFHHPRRCIPRLWRDLLEEDRHKWETVKWWNAQALIINFALRQTGGREPAWLEKHYGIKG